MLLGCDRGLDQSCIFIQNRLQAVNHNEMLGVEEG